MFPDDAADFLNNLDEDLRRTLLSKSNQVQALDVRGGARGTGQFGLGGVGLGIDGPAGPVQTFLVPGHSRKCPATWPDRSKPLTPSPVKFP